MLECTILLDGRGIYIRGQGIKMRLTIPAIKDSFLGPKASPRKALAIFITLAAGFHINKFIFGPDAMIRFQDTFDSEFPRLVNLARYLFEYGFVEWYPNIAGGVPVNAFHFTLLHPLVLLSGWLPPWLIHIAMVVGYSVLAGYGFYRFMTEFFRVEHGIAVLGGILFLLIVHFHFAGIAFNAFIFTFPMLFFLLHGQIHGENRRRTLLLRVLLLVILSLLSYPILGLVRFTLLHGAVLLVYFLWRRQFDLRMVVTAALFWAGYALVFLPNYLSLMDFMPFVQRNYQGNVFESFGAAVMYLASDFPSILVSQILICDQMQSFPLLVACVTLLGASRLVKLSFINFVFFCLLTAFFFSDLRTLFAGTFLQTIDLIYLRWVLPFSAAFFITVSLGELQRQTDASREHFLWLMLSALAALLVMLVALVGLSLIPSRWVWVSAFSKAALITFFTFFALKVVKPECWRFTSRGGAGLANASLALFFLVAMIVTGKPFRYEPYSYTEIFAERPALAALAEEHRAEPFRVAVVGVHPAQAQMVGLETFGGGSPVFNRYYKDYAGLVLAPQLVDEKARDIFENYWYHILMSEWHVRPTYNAFMPTDVTSRDWNLALLAVMNVRYIISTDPIPGLEAVEPAPKKPMEVGEGSPVYVYPLSGFLPRGYLVPEAEFLPTRNEVLARMASAGLSELRSKVFFAEEQTLLPPRFATPGRACGESSLSVYEPDRLVFDIEAAAPCYLVVSNNFDPKWTASLDGRPARLYRANHAFQAVVIPGAGAHRLELRFRDRRFPLILAAIAAGVILIALSPLANTARRRIVADGPPPSSPRGRAPGSPSSFS